MALKNSKMGASFGEHPAGLRRTAGKLKDSEEDVQTMQEVSEKKRREKRKRDKPSVHGNDLALQTRRG